MVAWYYGGIVHRNNSARKGRSVIRRPERNQRPGAESGRVRPKLRHRTASSSAAPYAPQEDPPQRELGFTARIRSRGEEARAIRREAGFRARRRAAEPTHGWLNRFRRIPAPWDRSPRTTSPFRISPALLSLSEPPGCVAWLGAITDGAQVSGGPLLPLRREHYAATLQSPEAAAQHWLPGGDRRKRFGCGRAAQVVASSGCSLFQGRLLFHKPLSPKPGALSYPLSTPRQSPLRWIGV